MGKAAMRCAAAFFGVILLPIAAARTAGAATDPAVAAAIERMQARIEQHIKAEPALTPYGIQVSVNPDGVATLHGRVPTPELARRAGTLAAIPGVATIDNQLAIDPSVATLAQSAARRREREHAVATSGSAASAPTDRLDE